MTELIFKDVWGRLGRAAKNTSAPAHVAVAFFGKHASKLLKLNAGSNLVVNASEACVKSGQTYPGGLKRLLQKGVRIYSVENLHAKVFVFGSQAFVGSANASEMSANKLIEAVIVTRERAAVSASRQFVRDLCLQELGPEELDRLSKMYRPPRIGGKRKPQGKDRVPKPQLRRIRITQLKLGYPPPASDETEAEGRKIAKSRMDDSKRHIIEVFWRRGKCPFRIGESVSEITKEDDGRLMASIPGNVVHLEPWRNGKTQYTFVYVERERRRRVLANRLAKKIGPGALQRLRRGGLASSEFSDCLWAAWAKPE